MYTEKSLIIEPNQEKRISKAMKKKTGCVIRVRKPLFENDQSEMGQTNNCSSGSSSKGVLHLAPCHLEKYNQAPAGSSVPLKFQYHHIRDNLQHHRGGFLPLIAAVLAPVIGGVASGLIEREIAGGGILPNGEHHSVTPSLFWCKKSNTGKKDKQIAFRIKPDANGQGLYLGPWKADQRHFASGHGLYYSPYHHMVKGVGLVKLNGKKLLPNHWSHFSKQQKKCIANLM